MNKNKAKKIRRALLKAGYVKTGLHLWKAPDNGFCYTFTYAARRLAKETK